MNKLPLTLLSILPSLFFYFSLYPSPAYAEPTNLAIRFVAPVSGGIPEGYRIEWGYNQGSHNNLVNLAAPEPCNEEELCETTSIDFDRDRTIYIVLHAYNQYGRSAKSNEVTLSPLIVEEPPGAPALLEAVFE